MIILLRMMSLMSSTASSGRRMRQITHKEIMRLYNIYDYTLFIRPVCQEAGFLRPAQPRYDMLNAIDWLALILQTSHSRQIAQCSSWDFESSSSQCVSHHLSVAQQFLSTNFLWHRLLEMTTEVKVRKLPLATTYSSICHYLLVLTTMNIS